jgi:uncharacterized coiled-coil protein SlyX
MDGIYTVSQGYANRVTTAGDYGVQLGALSYMEDDRSVSVGYFDSITGAGSSALGSEISILGDSAVGIGTTTRITGNHAIGIGLASNVTADHGIAIGDAATVSGINSIAIGQGTSISASNEIFMGNAATTSIGGTVNWTATSDGRFKTNVQSNVPGLDFINKLDPVTYNFDVDKLNNFNGTDALDAADKAEGTYSGFIAQDVQKVAEELGYDFSGVKIPENAEDQMYGLRYAEFVVPLVKATQELDVKIAAQDAQIETQQEILAAQQDLMQKYGAQLEEYNAAVESLKAEIEALEVEVKTQSTGISAFTNENK